MYNCCEHCIHQPSTLEIRSLAHHEYIRRLQIAMQHPIAVQIVNAAQDLKQQTLDHAFRHEHRLALLFCGAMKLDDMPEIVFGKVEQQPHFAIAVTEKDATQCDDVGVSKTVDGNS
jgi:hypothetical protein